MRNFLLCIIFSLLCLAGFFAVPATALAATGDASDYIDEHPTQKWAFVIGNSNYVEQEVIPSSSTDAKSVAKALRDLGFSVTEVHDVKRAPDFWTIYFQPFLDRIKENDFVVFYFSGHGLNYGGENFIAMTDFPKSISESEITDYLIALSSLRDLVTSRKAGLSLFLLDACRSIASNIMKQNGATDGVNKGMTPLRTTVENVAVGFSSDFGKISKGRDTPGAMSYYTDALLDHLEDEAKEFGYVKRQTRLKVIAETAGEQVPWFSDSVSTEIYLRPSAQLLADEKTVWLSRLASNNYGQVWDFTQEYPVSRYAGTAKRWLQQHSKTATPNTTKVPPQSLDNAFNPNDPDRRVVVPRVDGPFGFRTVASISGALNGVAASANRTIAEVLGQSDQLVVTRTMSAKSHPDENAPTVGTVAAGSTVKIKNFTADSSGASWVEFNDDGSSGFLPANRAVVGTSDVGYSLGEIEVGPSTGLESLVDEKPIRDAVAGFKANGRSISRVSIATAPTADERLQFKLKGRVAHVFYVLEQLGIAPGSISSASSSDGRKTPDGDKAEVLGNRVRIRFFGNYRRFR
jgi:hypothetical protein